MYNNLELITITLHCLYKSIPQHYNRTVERGRILNFTIQLPTAHPTPFPGVISM